MLNLIQTKRKDPAAVIAFAVAILTLWKYIQRRRYLAKVEESTGGIPGNMGLPGLGETMDFAKGPRPFIEARAKKYGKVFKTNAVGSNIVVVVSPDLAEHVYNSKDFASGTFSTFERLMEGFILLKNGTEHERPKRLLGYALSDAALQNNLQFFVNELDKAVSGWQGRAVAITAEVKKMLLRMMSKLIVSDMSEEDISLFSENIGVFAQGFFALPLNMSFSEYGKALMARTNCLKWLEGRVHQRRASPDKFVQITDLLQRFINYKDPETGSDNDAVFIAQNILVAIFGSIDTTSSLMVSCILLLNEHPDCLKRLQDEFRMVYGKTREAKQSFASTTLDQLNSLHYMHAFICEVLRVRSPFASGFRTAACDAPLPGTPYTVPKGWMIAIAQDYSFRTSSKEFPGVNTFNPDRFLPGNIARSHADFKHALFPFGKGAHLCPGRHFALAETKILLCTIMSKYFEANFPSVPNMPTRFVDKPSMEPENDTLVQF